MKYLYLLVGLIFLFPSITFAQNDTLSYIGTDVTIVASKITGVRGDISLTYDLIREEEIENSYNAPIFDLLDEKVSSFNVTQKGVAGYGIAGGSAGDVRIRGIGSSPNTNVLILIDGRPEFMGMMGHPLPDVYNSNQIEKVEIIKGPASTLYGSNAIGGVVNIITKKKKNEGISSSLKTKYGSFNTSELVFSNRGKIDKTSYDVILSKIKTDGAREWSEYKNRSATIKFGYEIDDNYEISLAANHTNFRIYDPGTVFELVEDHWYQVERNWFNFSLNNNSKRMTGSLKIHANTGYHRIYDGWRSNDYTAGLIFYQHLKLRNAIVTFGIDYKKYGGSGKNVDTDKDFGKHNIYEYAPYVNMQYFLGNWILNTGYRLEKNSVFGYEDAPKFAVTRSFSKGSVTLNISKGYRSPTIRELYLFPAPTPTLKPEELWNKELSAKYNFNNYINVESSLFQFKGSNFIKRIGQWPNFKLENSGSFTNTGFELSISGTNNKDINYNLSYTRIKIDNSNSAYVPGHKLNLNATKNYKKLSLSASIQKVWNYYAADNKQKRLKDYIATKINLNYQISKNLKLFGIIDNVLNEPYQIMCGYPMPKRQFYIGFDTEF